MARTVKTANIIDALSYIRQNPFNAISSVENPNVFIRVIDGKYYSLDTESLNPQLWQEIKGGIKFTGDETMRIVARTKASPFFRIAVENKPVATKYVTVVRPRGRVLGSKLSKTLAKEASTGLSNELKSAIKEFENTGRDISSVVSALLNEFEKKMHTQHDAA